MNKPRLLLFIVGLAVCLSLSLVFVATQDVSAQDGNNYVPDWTQYQGYLADGNGAPLTGSVDLYFALYDTSIGGNRYWEQYHAGVNVVDGYFQVQLGGSSAPLTIADFGTKDRYLEVRVASPPCRPGCTADDAAFEKLPRQPMGVAPYAIKAREAYSATNATNATYAANVNWNDIAGIPPGVVDGGYQNLVVVAKNGGDYTSLYTAVQSITDASAANPYLIYVAPGIYTETQTVLTKPYVHIRGAGKHAVVISNSSVDKTLVLQSNVSLQDLAIHNDYGGGDSYAIYADSAAQEAKPVYLYAVEAKAAYAGAQAGQYNHYGFYVTGGNVEAYLEEVDAYGERGSQYNYGAYIAGGAQVQLQGGRYHGWYGQRSYGVYATGANTVVNVDSIDTYGRNANYNYGYYNYQGATSTLNRGAFHGYFGDGKGDYCYGIYNEEATLQADDVDGYGYQCNTENHGLYNYYGITATIPADVTVNDSYFRGYKGGAAYGISNYGSGAMLHAHSTFGYGDESSDTSYGLYNSTGATGWIDGGIYRGYKSQGAQGKCFGMFNNNAAASTLELHDVEAYGKYCSLQNYGLYNRFGTVTAYGGNFYSIAETTGDSTQYCFGVDTGGVQASDVGAYVAYDVEAWAQNCYWNHAIFIRDGGYANLYGGNYFALGGASGYGAYCAGSNTKISATDTIMYAVNASVGTYGLSVTNGCVADVSGGAYYAEYGNISAGVWCPGANSAVTMQGSTVWGKYATSLNYGTLIGNNCQARLLGGTYRAEGGANSYAVQCQETSVCDAENLDSWAGKSTSNNIAYYNLNTAQSKLNNAVLHAVCPDAGCNGAVKYSMYQTGGDLKAAYTQYDNGTAGGYKWTSGTMKCLGVYDYNYDAVSCVLNP